MFNFPDFMSECPDFIQILDIDRRKLDFVTEICIELLSL